MQIIDDKIDGDYVFSANVNLTGMVAGNATVAAGAHVTITGMVTGNLLVEEGAYASVRGMVNGNVSSAGGKVEIHGMVGAVEVSDEIYVHPKAVVTGP